MKINLGCGLNELPGYVNMDLNPRSDRVLKIDLEKDKLPFEDNTIEEIMAVDLLEHIHNLIGLLGECYRVLQKDGVLSIEVPKFPSNAAIADPTHVRYFIPETFNYLTTYEGARVMYGIDPWKLKKILTTDSRIFVELQK